MKNKIILEFADWYINNIEGRSSSYFSNYFQSDKERFVSKLTEYGQVFEETYKFNPFEIEFSSQFISKIYAVLKNDLLEPFKEYNTKNQNGGPRALLGSKNYLYFLSDKITDKDTLLNNVSTNKSIFEDMLNDFQHSFNRPKRKKDKDILKREIYNLQDSLLNYLTLKLKKYNWQKEYKPLHDQKDRFDIFGYNIENDHTIIIELDPHRADSITKKFVSRTALIADKNVLYVAFVYPGTKSMSIPETEKYLRYCEVVAKQLDREFLGYFFKNIQ